jgi:hypothetical protein
MRMDRERSIQTSLMMNDSAIQANSNLLDQLDSANFSAEPIIATVNSLDGGKTKPK